MLPTQDQNRNERKNTDFLKSLTTLKFRLSFVWGALFLKSLPKAYHVEQRNFNFYSYMYFGV